MTPAVRVRRVATKTHLHVRVVAGHGHDQLVDQAQRRHLVAQLALGVEKGHQRVCHDLQRLERRGIQARLAGQLGVFLLFEVSKTTSNIISKSK